MSVVLDQLVQPASVFMAAALTLGGVFGRFPDGRGGGVAAAVTCGISAAVLVALVPDGIGTAEGVGPLVLVGSFLGGLVGALGAVLPPLAAVAVEGGPNALAIALGLVALAAAGTAADLVRRRRGVPLGRSAVLGLTLLSPVGLVGSLLAPAGGAVAVPVALWLPIGTLLFGFAVVAEHHRGEMIRGRSTATRFRELTDTVPVDMFRTQLDQQFRMHLRYGHEYALLLISIDDGPALRKRLKPAQWELVRAAVAVNVRRSVREPDLCAAVDFDRLAVLLPHASLPFALPVAARVQKAVAAGLVGVVPFDVTVSIGVAEVDGTLTAPDIEAAAEAELFLANMRTPRQAIGPWMDVAAQPALPVPGAEAPAPAPHGERRVRMARLVTLQEIDRAEAHDEGCVA